MYLRNFDHDGIHCIESIVLYSLQKGGALKNPEHGLGETFQAQTGKMNH